MTPRCRLPLNRRSAFHTGIPEIKAVRLAALYCRSVLLMVL